MQMRWKFLAITTTVMIFLLCLFYLLSWFLTRNVKGGSSYRH